MACQWWWCCKCWRTRRIYYIKLNKRYLKIGWFDFSCSSSHQIRWPFEFFFFFHFQSEETSQFGYEWCWSRANIASRSWISGNASGCIFASSHCRSRCEYAKFQIGTGLFAVFVCKVCRNFRIHSVTTMLLNHMFLFYPFIRLDIAHQHIIDRISSPPNVPTNWPYFYIMWPISFWVWYKNAIKIRAFYPFGWQTVPNFIIFWNPTVTYRRSVCKPKMF